MKKIIKKDSMFFYAMWLAASWAWGTSLVAGMEIVQTKGIIPFCNLGNSKFNCSSTIWNNCI